MATDAAARYGQETVERVQGARPHHLSCFIQSEKAGRWALCPWTVRGGRAAGLSSAATVRSQEEVRYGGRRRRVSTRTAGNTERLSSFREAITMSSSSSTTTQGDALFDLAEVLAAGRSKEAAAALEQALERYQRKKNLAMVAQVRVRLAELRRPPRGSHPRPRQFRCDLREVPEPRRALRQVPLEPAQRCPLEYFGDPRSAWSPTSRRPAAQNSVGRRVRCRLKKRRSRA